MSTERLRRQPQFTLFTQSVEDLPHTVEITDIDGVLLYVNKAFERLYGYSAEEVLGKTPRQVMRSHEHSEEFYRKAWQAISENKVWVGRLISKTKSGALVHADTVVFPVRNDAGETTHYVAIRRDVTEQQQLRAQLIQSERLAALGLLSAGVAHEVNNPLTYVQSTVDELGVLMGQLDSDVGAQAQQLLGDLRGGIDRIEHAIRELRAFAQPQEDRPAPLDVRDLLDLSLKLASNEIRHRARVVRAYESVPKVLASEQRLSQVFLNLVLNAAQAIPAGAVEDNEIRVATHHARSGAVIAEISDTGCGIPERLLERVFEPLVTTKTEAEGTGLGLFICRKVVKELGGQIRLQSKPGQGTTFTVTLPPAAIAAAERPQRKARAPSNRLPPLSLLVVDDEPGVARALARILSFHRVTTCGGGREALTITAERKFDAIVCDLMMPDVSGIHVAEGLSRQQPPQHDRLILMTGGAFTPEAREFLKDGNYPLVTKPFNPQEVLEAIRIVVQRPRPSP